MLCIAVIWQDKPTGIADHKTANEFFYRSDELQIIQGGFIRATESSKTEEIITGVCTFGNCPVEKKEYENDSFIQETSATGSPAVYTEVQEEQEEEYYDDTEELIEEQYQEYDETYYSPSYFMKIGIIYWRGWAWTWYSERVLPGNGLHIPGRYTDDTYGYVRDGDGYICLASDSLAYGTVVQTPFGSPGKVYDEVGGDDSIIDVYVGW